MQGVARKILNQHHCSRSEEFETIADSTLLFELLIAQILSPRLYRTFCHAFLQALINAKLLIKMWSPSSPRTSIMYPSLSCRSWTGCRPERKSRPTVGHTPPQSKHCGGFDTR